MNSDKKEEQISSPDENSKPKNSEEIIGETHNELLAYNEKMKKKLEKRKLSGSGGSGDCDSFGRLRRLQKK